jgi:uncharacterized protein YybS (DUF2232 family)
MKVSAFFAKSMQGWEGALNQTDTANAFDINQVINAIKPYITGMIAIFIAFNALLQVWLARWWQSIVYNPGGLRRELYEIRMSHLLGVVFLVALVWQMWDKTHWLVDSMPILYVLFAIAGLSLLHKMFAMRRGGWFWLSLIYVAMLLFPQTIILCAMLGLLDTWVDFRKKLGLKMIG